MWLLKMESTGPNVSRSDPADASTSRLIQRQDRFAPSGTLLSNLQANDCGVYPPRNAGIDSVNF